MNYLNKLLKYLLLLVPAFIHAQDIKKTVPVVRISLTPEFDISGEGKADAWNKAEWIPLPPRKGPQTGYQTQVKLLYSDKGVYCLFSCADRQITSTLKEDFANLFKEDVVEIFFWPDESVPVYFEYELSPYGYELPIIVPNINGRIQGWRPWHYEGDKVTRRAATIQKTEKGVTSWTAEFFIPFSLLRPLIDAPPKKGDRWRVNMYRIDYDEGTTQWSWQPTRKNFHDFESFGAMVFE